MSRHARHRAPAPRPHRARRRLLGSTMVRALLSLGLVAGAASTGTFAFWTDEATVTGITLSTGTLDLKLNGQDNIAGYTNLNVSNMIPGQSSAAVLTVNNAGTTDFTYTATTTASNADGKNLRGALVVKVTGGTVSGSNPTATCTGSTLACTGTTLNGGLVNTARALAAATNESLCIQVSLPSGAGNALQGASTAVTMTFNAVQAP